MIRKREDKSRQNRVVFHCSIESISDFRSPKAFFTIDIPPSVCRWPSLLEIQKHITL